MWNTLAQILVPAATSIYGAYESSRANERAAQIENQSTLQAAQIQAGAIDRATQAQTGAINRAIDVEEAARAEEVARLERGYGQAGETLRGLRVETAPGVTHLRGVVADPTTLSPDQTYHLDNLRQNVGNVIRSSGFAGSGRTAAELFREVEGDYVNRALADNRTRADNAAGRLFNVYANTGGAIANTEAGAGQDIGRTIGRGGESIADTLISGGEAQAKGIRDIGTAQSGATSSVGQTNADLTTSNARLRGEAVGDIGSLIAAQGRESRYADRVKKYEQALGLN